MEELELDPIVLEDVADQQTPPPEEELYELNNLGEITQVNLEQMRVLAQKGQNWDHMKAERDEARKQLEEKDAFLKELAGENTVEAYMDSIRAKAMAEKEGIDESVALGRVQLARERAAFEASKTGVVSNEQRESYIRFAERFPGLTSKDIPENVWDAHRNGEDLSLAYLTHRNKELTEQLEALKQNTKNANRSTGSMKDAGKSGSADPWMAVWADE